MSYYGASGTAHKYVATDQPLYGLGSFGLAGGLGAFGTEAIPSTYAPPGIKLVAQDASVSSTISSISETLVDVVTALQTGVLCWNRPAGPVNGGKAGNILRQWADEGNFVVFMRKAGPCIVQGQSTPPYSAYKFSKSAIGAIANDPDAFVLYMPFREAPTEASWSKYGLNPGAGSTINPTLPVGPTPVVSTEVPTSVPVSVPAEAGMSTGAKVAIAAVVAYVAYRVFKGPSYAANEDFED